MHRTLGKSVERRHRSGGSCTSKRASESTSKALLSTVESQELVHEKQELEKRVKQVEKEAQDFKQERNDIDRQIQQNSSSIEETREKIDAARLLLERTVMSHEEKRSAVVKQDAELDLQIADLRENTMILERSVAFQEKAMISAREQVAELEAEQDHLQKQKDHQHWVSVARILFALQIRMAKEELEAYKGRLVERRSILEARRKVLYNVLQEIRGNIRVFARIRPVLPCETRAGEQAFHYSVDEAEMQLDVKVPPKDSVTGRSAADDTTGGGTRFTFDRVFGPKAQQAEVFEEISQLVQSALDGFNVCIFAYGQTGSGKTHTMEGLSDDDDNLHASSNEGMIPRAVKRIFACIEDMQRKDWRYSLEMSCLEIYNETVRDLLAPAAADKATSGQASAHPADVKLDGKGATILYNVQSIPVTSFAMVDKYLQVARRNRTSAATASNEHSSRSHSVFQIKLQAAATTQSFTSTLSLVDLAGSERVSKSGVTGARLKEAQFINRSLSALGDVIFGLASKKREHIPYRNSKLTILLRDSLGGDSKTLMFANVSPLLANISETINSLRFAAKVNAIVVTQKRFQGGRKKMKPSIMLSVSPRASPTSNHPKTPKPESNTPMGFLERLKSV